MMNAVVQSRRRALLDDAYAGHPRALTASRHWGDEVGAHSVHLERCADASDPFQFRVGQPYRAEHGTRFGDPLPYRAIRLSPFGDERSRDRSSFRSNPPTAGRSQWS